MAPQDSRFSWAIRGSYSIGNTTVRDAKPTKRVRRRTSTTHLLLVYEVSTPATDVSRSHSEAARCNSPPIKWAFEGHIPGRVTRRDQILRISVTGSLRVPARYIGKRLKNRTDPWEDSDILHFQAFYDIVGVRL